MPKTPAETKGSNRTRPIQLEQKRERFLIFFITEFCLAQFLMSFGGLISSGNSGGVGGSRAVAEIAPHSSGAIAHPHFIPNSMQSSSALSLSIVCFV